MVALNKPEPVNLPCIGIWNSTPNHAPPAGCTLLGLWHDQGASHVLFCCAFYLDANGEAVDPDEDDDWETIEFRSRQGNESESWDDPIPPPDCWAECRFLIPAF